MMHGHEKSDLAIVAAKPTNKAEQSAAEPVERRAGTKGNAGQQSTYRTQSRISVTQALERIRKVARARKKERFTALFHHLSIEQLEDSFDELKQNAAPGVDGLTWEAYDADLERNLADLHSRLHRGAYRALPSRGMYIPKSDGRCCCRMAAASPASPGRQNPTAGPAGSSFSSMPALTSTSRMRSARPRLVGALSGNLQERAHVPHQEGGVGAVPHRAELRDRRQARRVRRPAISDRGVRPVRQAGRAALGHE